MALGRGADCACCVVAGAALGLGCCVVAPASAAVDAAPPGCGVASWLLAAAWV